MANVDGMVDAAVRAFKKGDRDEAQALLIRATESDQMHENAWMWLSAVVGTQEDQRVCLENVLYINPDNERAKRGMALLNQGTISGPIDVMGEDDDDAIESTVLTTRNAAPQAEDAFADMFSDAIEQDVFAGVDFDEDEAPEPDAFDDIFSDVEEEDDSTSPFGASGLEYEEEELPRQSASSRRRPQSPGRDRDPMGLDASTDGQGGFYTGETSEAKEERDPSFYFRAIPKDIKATNLPGSDEKYPAYIIPGIAVLSILNLFALGMLITNL